MKHLSLRSSLVLSAACLALAACSGGGSNSNNGSTGPVTVGGGGGGGGTSADVSFIPAGFTCPTGTSAGTNTVGTTSVEACVIPAGTITSDLTLTGLSGGNPVGYFLEGSTFIGENLISNSAGATAVLTIEAGAIIIGANGEDALFINPGSQIEAIGTAANPIVMTSATDAADGSVDDGLVNGSSTAKGEWGGLVINGLARINDCNVSTATPGTAACNKTGEGGSGLFGGDNDADDSGELRYVRVQYAGFRFNGEDELNGIAFQGVGSGTDVNFIQVHNGNDDGVEFFGGTVNAKNVVVTGADDDSIDWTDGWRGDLQFALVVQDDVSADRGIEGDNRGNDTNVGEAEGVVSNPQISNITFFGSSASAASPSDGIKLRAGTNANIANAIVVGFGLGDGLDFDRNNDIGGGTIVTANATPTIQSMFVAENGSPFDSDGGTLFNANATNSSQAASTLDGVIPGTAENSVTPTDISGGGNTLSSTNFIGAFDPNTESNASNWTTGWTLDGTVPGAVNTGCPTGTADTGAPADFGITGRTETRVCQLPNTITSDLTLVRGNLYTFAGSVFIGNDAGPDADNPTAPAVTLTVDPGVTVYGAAGEDAIIVNRGSRLVAQGAQAAPIIFTSLSDLDGTVAATAKGEWGGLVINGRALINDCNVSTATPGTIDCEKTGEGGSGLFGGNRDTDDSGVLSFVQVKFAGFRFNGEDELNGIAFQGVGSGTQVDHIQVHNGNDDGVEFFGGAVNAKYVVVTGADDDSIDWTDGWRGSVQYALVIQDNVSADRGIEGDNRGNDPNVGEAEGVVSNPSVANFTFFGSSDAAASPGDGVKLRAGTDGFLANGIIVGFAGDGVDFDRDNDIGGGTIVTGNATPEIFGTYAGNNGGGADQADSDGATIFVAANGNAADETTSNMDGFIPNATLQGLITVNDDLAAADPNLEDADYVGAFDPATETNTDNWTTGWTFNVSTSLPNVN
jgi:hypothetical protein